MQWSCVLYFIITTRYSNLSISRSEKYIQDLSTSMWYIIYYIITTHTTITQTAIFELPTCFIFPLQDALFARKTNRKSDMYIVDPAP